jgi:hypothetical protein
MDVVKHDIPGHFKNIFCDLYNSAEDKEDLLKVLDDLKARVDETSLHDVKLGTLDTVRQFAKNLNDSKSDPQLYFSSDCIKSNTIIEEWRLHFIRDIIESKNNQMNILNIDNYDLD